jgi:hypothetical protein
LSYRSGSTREKETRTMSMLSPEDLERLAHAESLFPSPIPVQPVSSDEFAAGPQTPRQREFEARVKEMGRHVRSASA